MAELYWMALTRDVAFSQYGVDEATLAAAGNTHVVTYRISHPRMIYKKVIRATRPTFVCARALEKHSSKIVMPNR